MNGAEAMAGVVLAGGKSRRFGSDKASALLGGRPLLQWVVDALAEACDEFVVVRAAGQALPLVETGGELRVVEDREPERGPLAGMASGFAVLESPLAFVASCDAPLIAPAVIRWLAERAKDTDVVLPEVDGYRQTLGAVYRVATCLPRFEAALAEGTNKITDAFTGLRVRAVSADALRGVDPELLSYRNANTPEALAEIASLIDR